LLCEAARTRRKQYAENAQCRPRRLYSQDLDAVETLSRLLLQTSEDLAGLRRVYAGQGPIGSAGAAFTGTSAEAVERRVEDAAFGLRWLEIVHARHFDLEKSLAPDVRLAE
jgi:hypothetical protein